MNLLKNQSTRLRFCIYVIIANFIFGGIAMYLEIDLGTVGTFLSLANTPLYAYVLGRSYRGSNTQNNNMDNSNSVE